MPISSFDAEIKLIDFEMSGIEKFQKLAVKLTNSQKESVEIVCPINLEPF